MIRRATFTETPPPGDYVVSTTGLTWSVDRRGDNGIVMRVVAGEPNKKGALARALELAAGSREDVWETFGTGSYRLVKRFRVAA